MPTYQDVEIDEKKWLEVLANFKGEPQQLEGARLLFEVIKKADFGILTKTQPWFEKYTEKKKEVAKPKSMLLKVPYQSQNDNKSGTGYRECFSSTCAMIAMYWKKVSNDDAYNNIRARYGDSTSAEAQLAALRALGLTADFHTDGRPADLLRELEAGRPVGVGWLHRGRVESPSGGGHWSCLVGATETHWIMNDPNGEALLVMGGYTANTNGAGLAYSKRNWEPRWMPGGSGGWYLSARPRG